MNWGSEGREVCVDVCDTSWTPLSLVSKGAGTNPRGEAWTNGLVPDHGRPGPPLELPGEPEWFWLSLPYIEGTG